LLITLIVTDRANGALVSHSIAVNFTLAVLERLSSPRSKRMLIAPKPNEGASGIVLFASAGAQ
jgi:hypothetical protein